MRAGAVSAATGPHQGKGNNKKSIKDMTREEVEKALDEYSRPFLREHMGDVKVTRIEDDTVFVSFLGECAACAMVASTMDSVESALRKHVPGVEHVVMDTMDLDFYRHAKAFLDSLHKKE